MSDEDPIPKAVIDRVVTLSRRARAAVDENERNAYREERAELLERHGYEARIRDDDTGSTLVLYPTKWVEDGTVRFDRIEDTDRAIERSLSGPGTGENWDEIDEHNRSIAATVEAHHGDVHGETASAFAAFMSNHYAKPIEDATAAEREEFRQEYFPRNAWPSDEQRERLDRSMELIFETVGSTDP
jgi:hypothetical protein